MISQFFCYSDSSKNITCPSGKLKTEFTSQIAKSTSPWLSDTKHTEHSTSDSANFQSHGLLLTYPDIAARYTIKVTMNNSPLFFLLFSKDMLLSCTIYVSHLGYLLFLQQVGLTHVLSFYLIRQIV